MASVLTEVMEELGVVFPIVTMRSLGEAAAALPTTIQAVVASRAHRTDGGIVRLVFVATAAAVGEFAVWV